MTRRNWPVGLLLLALGLGGVGCGKLREVSVCRGIARDVNAAMDEIEALARAKPVDELRIAKRYAELAARLAPRGVGQQPLAVAVSDYLTVLHATEAALKNHHAGTKAPSAKVEPRRELERLVKRERSAASRIETECHN